MEPLNLVKVAGLLRCPIFRGDDVYLAVVCHRLHMLSIMLLSHHAMSTLQNREVSVFHFFYMYM